MVKKGCVMFYVYCILFSCVYFLCWWVLLRFILSKIERRKPFIKTKDYSHYNLYSFIRSFLFISAFDKATNNRDAFPYKGIVVYEGNQGNGKTISLVHDTLCIMRQYPKCALLDNLGIVTELQNEHHNLDHWKQLIELNNGIFGYVVCIDEFQNWCSNKLYKSSSVCSAIDLLSIVTQNRKNRRIILGTCQKFFMLDKSVRTQCSEIRSCFTLFGCISGYIRKAPYFDGEGNIKQVKFKGIRLFVHSTELRNSYDTYKVIQALSSEISNNEIQKIQFVSNGCQE